MIFLELAFEVTPGTGTQDDPKPDCRYGAPGSSLEEAKARAAGGTQEELAGKPSGIWRGFTINNPTKMVVNPC